MTGVQTCALPICLTSRLVCAQSAESKGRLSVVELYTSEGCSSCPSADEWLDSTFPRADAVAIAYHVDYWNQLGWPDPFSSAAYTEKQQRMAARDGGTVYTPEVTLDGHEARRGSGVEALLAARPATRVRVSLTVTRTGDTLHVQARSSDPSLALRAVLVESGLEVLVPRGENAGRRLRHDHVARRMLEGNNGTLGGTIELRRDWNRGKLGVVALVEDVRSGDIRQAVFVPHLD